MTVMTHNDRSQWHVMDSVGTDGIRMPFFAQDIMRKGKVISDISSHSTYLDTSCSCSMNHDSMSRISSRVIPIGRV